MKPGHKEWMENVLIERYKGKTNYGGGGKETQIFEFIFYSDKVSMTRNTHYERNGLDYLVHGGSGFCMFDMGDEVLSIFDINAPLPRGEELGRFTIKRLEELAKEKNLKRIEIIGSENNYYWGEKLKFHRTSSKRRYGGKGDTIDFVKPITEKAEAKYPPIITKSEFILIERQNAEEKRVSFDAKQFDRDAANTLGISLSEYYLLDSLDISRRLKEIKNLQNTDSSSFISQLIMRVIG